MIEPDSDLPDGFTSETQRDGRVTLRRHGVIAGEFPMLTPRTALSAWAEAYERGFTAGQKAGVRWFVARLRDWLNAEAA